jgi:DNA-binding SARP family transcriptional activator
VESRTPALRAAYENELRNVNAYIRDAEQSVETDPNDEEAQQTLMEAYGQKAVVYELAMDRSLP